MELGKEGLAARLGDELAQDRRGRVGADAERPGSGAASGVEDGELGDLPAVRVAEGDPVVPADRHHRRAARAHPEDLVARIERLESRRERKVATAMLLYARAAVFASSSAACAMSCSASSRLAAASSFLTSFSTARRL